MSETPTPRTDELMDSWRQAEGRYGWKRAIIDHARELERELIAAQTALSAAEQRAEAMGSDVRQYHIVMAWLRDMNLPHGKCEPRSDKACTHCNAADCLSAFMLCYRGAPVSIQPAAIASGAGESGNG